MKHLFFFLLILSSTIVMGSNISPDTEFSVDGITITDVIPYFSISIKDAASQLGIAETSIKKMCRQKGIKRWPMRTIRSCMHYLDLLGNNCANNDTIQYREILLEILQSFDRGNFTHANDLYKQIPVKYLSGLKTNAAKTKRDAFLQVVLEEIERENIGKNEFAGNIIMTEENKNNLSDESHLWNNEEESDEDQNEKWQIIMNPKQFRRIERTTK